MFISRLNRIFDNVVLSTSKVYDSACTSQQVLER